MSAPASGLDATHATYDPAFFDRLARIEDGHAWFRVRNGVIAALVAQVVLAMPARDTVRMLDVGCGTGGVLAAIGRAAPAVSLAGIDLHPAALAYARARLGPCALLAAGDALHPPFGPVFDLVGMFDVLEHLPDDVAALRAQRALLRPGGVLILTVPADPALWSYFDEAARHARRYTESTLASALQAAGFEVEYLSPMMAPLLPMLATYRRLASVRAPRGDRQVVAAAARRDLGIVPVVNGIMAAVLSRELPRIRERRRIGRGTSLVAIARPAAPFIPGDRS